MKMDKLKLYNILMYSLILVIVVTLILLAIKYILNYINEKDKTHTITSIYDSIGIYKEENVLSGTLGEENTQEVIIPSVTYKGYPVIGIIKIDKINIEYPILDNNTPQALNKSIVKYYGCMVGEVGNISLAGHNNLDNTMFGQINKLEIGDNITLITMTGEIVNYTILQKYITVPEDIGCTKSLDETKREVTLITCINGNKNRLIIKAQEL